jgi:hypothetical protein
MWKERRRYESKRNNGTEKRGRKNFSIELKKGGRR